MSSYFLEIPHYTPVGEKKTFKKYVRKVYSAFQNLYTLVVCKVIYVDYFTLFISQMIYLFDFFIFSPFHGNWGFQAYLPAKHCFAIFRNIQMSIRMKNCLKTVFLPLITQKNL